MPTQQRCRAHDPARPQLPRQQPRQCRQQHSICRLQPRTTDLATQHRYLMPQHQQFDTFDRATTTPNGDQAKHRPHNGIHHRQHHQMIIPNAPRRPESRLWSPKDIPAARAGRHARCAHGPSSHTRENSRNQHRVINRLATDTNRSAHRRQRRALARHVAAGGVPAEMSPGPAHRSMPPSRGERMTATERSPVKAQALENLEQDREQAANHLPAT